VITQGFGGMPDYASQISPEDRWKIVAYVRALQLSQSSSIQELPASERIRLGEPPTGSGALPPPSDGRKP
jgi:hypothetical protein